MASMFLAGPKSAMSGRTCREIFFRQIFCNMCGATSGDIDELTGQPVLLHPENPHNPRVSRPIDVLALCSTCYEGVAEMQPSTSPFAWIRKRLGRTRAR